MKSKNSIRDIEETILQIRGLLGRSIWCKRLSAPTKNAWATMVARYHAAICVEFQAWLGVTCGFVRHERAQWALKDNLRCEFSENHIHLLAEFTRECCGGLSQPQDYEWVVEPVNALRDQVFKDIEDVGVTGLTVLAILEATSVDFMPILARAGQILGAKTTAYTRKHGGADKGHATALMEGLVAEIGAGGYIDPIGEINHAAGLTSDLVLRIFDDTDFRKKR